MAQPPALVIPKASPSGRDIGFAFGIVMILCIVAIQAIVGARKLGRRREFQGQAPTPAE